MLSLYESRSYPFTQYPDAIQPVTIIGFIPQGSSLIFNPPEGPSFSWNPVNLTEGTSIVFYMTDSQGRNGGTGPVDAVARSDDQSCLETASSSGNPLHSGAPGATSNSHTPLVAGVVAVVATLILVLTFSFFYIRRRRNQRPTVKMGPRKPIDPPVYEHARSPALEGDSYLMVPTKYTDVHVSEVESTTAHARKQQMILEYRVENKSFHSGLSRNHSMTQYPPSASEPTLYFDTSSHSTLRSYSSMVATSEDSDLRKQYKSPPRLIVHTDIAELEVEALEIPPQYSEGRVPIPGLVTSESQDTT
uniref:Uncharacterized protein n=1 Tax=Psilocybe cubensis TaxID=181762 RepID=A0A8H7XK19_PSICU